jgi:hypothetical protein
MGVILATGFVILPLFEMHRTWHKGRCHIMYSYEYV